VRTRMHELHFLVGELRKGEEQLRQVGTHVRVGTIPNRQLGVLQMERNNIGLLIISQRTHCNKYLPHRSAVQKGAHSKYCRANDSWQMVSHSTHRYQQPRSYTQSALHNYE